MISSILIINLLGGSAIATETVAPTLLLNPSSKTSIGESQGSSIVQKVSSTSYIKFLVDNIFSDIKNRQFKPIDQRIFLDFTHDKSLRLNIFIRICETSPEMVFGNLKQKALDLKEEWSEEKKKRIKNGYQLFNDLFSSAAMQHITFKELKNLIDEKLFSPNSVISDREILGIGNAFRHLIHPYFNNLTTDVGDYAAEYILTRLIEKIETDGSGASAEYNEETYKILSEIYYQLSQTYTHLLSYSNKIAWEENDVGYILYKAPDQEKRFNFPVIYQQIKDKRLHLLQQAISYNPNNFQAWVRVLEFYFSEEDKGSFQEIATKEITNLDIHYLHLLIKLFTDAIKNQDIHFVNKESLNTHLLKEFESKNEAIKKKVSELKLQQGTTRLMEVEKNKEDVKKKLLELELKKKREAALKSIGKNNTQNSSSTFKRTIDNSISDESNIHKKQRIIPSNKKEETLVYEDKSSRNVNSGEEIIGTLEEHSQLPPNPSNKEIVREENSAPFQ